MNRISELFSTELSAVSVEHLLLCVGLCFALSLYIILVYRLVYSGVLYSKRFALSLMVLSFMFWAIVNGIICGAGFVLISIIASLAIGALILAVFYLGRVSERDLYLVVVRTKDDVSFASLSPILAKAQIKSCSSSGGLQETVTEVRLNNKQLNALRDLTSKEGVISVDIVSYNTKTGL